MSGRNKKGLWFDTGAPSGRPKQMKHWAVCQKCGSVLPIEQAKAEGWFISPLRADPRYNVIRCWRHITTAALRISLVGEKSKEWRQKAKEGRERDKMFPRLASPLVDPFPMRDIPLKEYRFKPIRPARRKKLPHHLWRLF